MCWEKTLDDSHQKTKLFFQYIALFGYRYIATLAQPMAWIWGGTICLADQWLTREFSRRLFEMWFRYFCNSVEVQSQKWHVSEILWAKVPLFITNSVNAQNKMGKYIIKLINHWQTIFFISLFQMHTRWTVKSLSWNMHFVYIDFTVWTSLDVIFKI